MLNIDKIALFDHLIEQHVQEAAFLWLQRALAVNQVHQPIFFLRKVEQRINNHLKGLLIAPENAWDIALRLAEEDEEGALFVLAFLAIHSGEDEKINTALEFIKDNRAALKEFISVLGWLPDEKVYPLLKPWIESKNVLHRFLSIAACSVRRLNPQSYFASLLAHTETCADIPLYCRLLRLVGELKRHDLVPYLNSALSHDNKEVVFWANSSLLLLGHFTTLATFEPYVVRPHRRQISAINLAFRCQSQVTAWNWINKLINTQQIAQAIIALSVLGDPHGINWLLARMVEPAHAKIAGHAFSMITGIDLMEEDLARQIEKSDEEEDEEESLDEQGEEIYAIRGYENLPLPHVEKITHRWQQLRHQFHAGQRYFLGQPVSAAVLQHTIRNGLQGQRRAACMEHALMEKTNAFANVQATFKQQGVV